jgi:uncharacterized protein (DUF1501 family)
MVDRRTVLKASAQLTLLAPFAKPAWAAADSDPRLVLVILRGGLDGLAAVPPYGEGRYRSLRGLLALEAPGTENGALKLDGLFGLHPALSNLHAMYRAGEATVLHAAATPYRERSHFDAQKVLEAGGTSPTVSAGGWLNRALSALAGTARPRDAVALGDSVPLVLRGEFAVDAWAPSRLPETGDDTLARVKAMYEAVDPPLAERLDTALAERALAGGADIGAGMGGRGGQAAPLASAAARFLASADGPRIAVIDIGGWDTHANQGAAQGRLAARLRVLDAGLQSLKSELGECWRETSVLVVTEFGRTAAVNGTGGTDHGTAGCAFLAGGAVNGGRVVTDWPGLRSQDLREGRDLKPTLDLRAAFKGVLAEQLGVGQAALERTVFPDSGGVRRVEGLIA